MKPSRRDVVEDWLHAHGFVSLTQLAEQHPRSTNLELARRIGAEISARRVETRLCEEAEEARTVAAFARAQLVRHLRDRMTAGWGHGTTEHVEPIGVVSSDFLSVASGAFTAWTMSLPWRDRSVADVIWQRFRAMDIPDGWLPEGPDDPYIARAFAGVRFPTDEGDTSKPPLPDEGTDWSLHFDPDDPGPVDAMRWIPRAHDMPFPYEAARQLLERQPGMRMEPADIEAVIASGLDGGWPRELVAYHQGLAERGRCFSFRQEEEPGLAGTLYEETVYFFIYGEEHQAACMPFIKEGAKLLGVRLVRH